MDKFLGLEIFCRAEGADYGGDITLLGVDLGVEMTHFLGGDFAGEIGEGGAELREFFEGGLADDGDGVVGREIAEIVFKSKEMEGVDEAVGGIAGDDIDLMIDQGAIEEAEVHDLRRGREMEAVTLAPPGEAVGALEEFVADADAPWGNDGGEIGHGVEMEFLRVVAADDHGEAVFEAERFGEEEMEAPGVLLFDAIIDFGGSVAR